MSYIFSDIEMLPVAVCIAGSETGEIFEKNALYEELCVKLNSDSESIFSILPVLQTTAFTDGGPYRFCSILREGCLECRLRKEAGRYYLVISEPEDNRTLSYRGDQRFRLLFENAPFSVQSFDAEGYMIDANSEWEKMWQLKKESMSGYNILNDPNLIQHHPDTLRRIRKSFRNCEAVRLPEIEYRASENFGGADRIVAARMYPVVENGTLSQMVMIHEDVTEIRRIRKLHEGILRALPDMLVIIDSQGYISFFKKGERDPVIPAESFIGRKYTTALPENVVNQIEPAVRRILKTGKPQTVRYSIAKDGCEIISESRMSMLPDRRMLSVVRDITREEQAMDALKASEERFKKFMKHLPGSATVTSAGGRLLYVNEGYLELTGLSEEDSIGRKVAEFLPPDLSVEVERQNRMVLASQVPMHFENRYPVNGEEKIYLTTRFLIYGRAEEPDIGMLAVDITDRKRFEDTISQQNIDLIKSREHLKETLQKAEEANRAKTVFLSNMSHDIRTPMNALLGIAELLSGTDLTEEQREYVSIFARAGESLMLLIDDILDFSRFESGSFELEKKSFSFKQLLIDVIDLFRYKARQQQLELNLQIDDNLPNFIVSDERRLRQVIVNLLGNALKFTEHGSVTLSCRFNSAENKITVSVKDTGRGIHSENINRIFNRFYRTGHENYLNSDGAGLGLSICNSVISHMQGSLTVDSEPGRGSTFTFTVPVEVDAAEDARGVENARAITESLEKISGRILLTDDSADNRLLVKRFLRSDRIRIDEAVNGSEAVELFRKNKYDLVLMDVQMPVLDGYSAVKIIRSHEKGGRTPVLALTAYALPEERERSISAGCDDHLAKPITREKLVRAILNYLSEAVP